VYKDKREIAIHPEYSSTLDVVLNNFAKIQDYMLQFRPAIAKSDFDKVMFAHNFCMNNLKYDERIYGDDWNVIPNSHLKYEDSYSIMGPILYQKGVCSGISRFFKLALDYLGIKSIVVVGDARSPKNDGTMEPHAWNIVKIDNITYQFDVTWNICHQKHTYFALTDSEMKGDHVIPQNVPECTMDRNAYFTFNSLSACSPVEMREIIERNLKANKNSFFIKAGNVTKPNELKMRVEKIATEQLAKLFGKNIKPWVIFYEDLSVLEISCSP